MLGARTSVETTEIQKKTMLGGGRPTFRPIHFGPNGFRLGSPVHCLIQNQPYLKN